MTAFLLEAGPAGPRLRLTGETGIAEARALCDALRPALAGAPAWSIDATACTRLDLAALQVLAAAHVAAPGGRLDDGAAPAWREAWERYGLADPFAAVADGSAPLPFHAQERARSG